MTDPRDPFDPTDPGVPPGRPDPFAPRRYDAPQPHAAPRSQDAPRGPVPDAAEPPSLVKRLQEGNGGDRLKKVGGPFGFAALLIWKIGRIALVALGKVAILFKIPLLGTVLSGAVSIGAYAVFYGWSFAFGLVGSLLVHELGHVVQIKREGLPVKALNFVPFLGAYVLTEAPQTADQQARVSIAGPVAGTLLAVLIYVVAAGDPLLEAVAYTGFFLNLFNLLPIPMLDGGGVGGLFTAGWWLGIAGALGLVALASGTGFAAIAALAAVLMTWIRRERGFALDPGDGVSVGARAGMAALYVGVMAVCAFGMAAAFRDRTDQLVDQYGSRDVPAVVASQR